MKTKLLIILMIVICSCGRKGINEISNTDSILKIDLLSEPGSTVKNLSEIAANVEYIPLQTLESSIIGNIKRKIVHTVTRVYILTGEEILCFDNGGKFLFKLQNRGRGPEEYTYIADFDVSSDNRILILLSISKLLLYGISDKGFEFQRSISLKDPALFRVSMVPETNNAFLSTAPWRGSEQTLSLVINNTGDTIHSRPNYYKYKMVNKMNYRAENECIVYSLGANVCYKERFCDTLFNIDSKDNSFKPRIIFDSHGTNVSPEMRGGSQTLGNNITFIASAFETSRYVFCRYFTIDKQNGFLFDKNTMTKHKLFELAAESEMNGVTDDLNGGPDFKIEFRDHYCSGNKLFSFAEAITLKKYIESEDFKKASINDPKKKEELKKLADSLKETDNPVLIVVTPKE